SVALYIMNEAVPAAPAPAPAIPAVKPRALVGVAAGSALGGVVLTAAVAWMMRPAPPPPQPTTRFAIAPPPAQALSIQRTERDSAISPDGSHIVYRAGAGAGLGQLAVRRVDQLDAQVLTGVINARGPFFSPDGHWIGFFEGAELKKISITGGPAIAL